MPYCCRNHGALACTPLGETFQHKPGCRTTNTEDGFQAFHLLQLHYIRCAGEWGGGEVVKIITRSGGGEEIILLLRAGRGGGARDNNFSFEAHFSALRPDKLLHIPLQTCQTAYNAVDRSIFQNMLSGSSL